MFVVFLHDQKLEFVIIGTRCDPQSLAIDQIVNCHISLTIAFSVKLRFRTSEKIKITEMCFEKPLQDL